MANPASGSITQLISYLKKGEDDAARRLWDIYFEKLVRLARQKLRSTSRRLADEEDVALSVFRRLCKGAEEGRFAQLADRDDLWRLLIAITSHRVIDQRRFLTQQKRGGGKVRGHSAMNNESSSTAGGFEDLIADDPTPEMLVEISEEHQRLMDRLDDSLRQIAVWKMDNLNNEEIAERLGITSRSVRRKLERIRQLWVEEAEA